MEESNNVFSGFGFREDLVMLNMKAANQYEAIIPLAEMLHTNGYVEDGFLEALLKREIEYPTGLPTLPYGTAIPHASVQYVKTTAVGIGVLEEPVQFRMMGSPEIPIQVKVIFLLGIKEAHAQVTILRFIVEILQQVDLLESIVGASDAGMLAEILNQRLADYSSNNHGQ